jgi:hypothetical protein
MRSIERSWPTALNESISGPLDFDHPLTLGLRANMATSDRGLLAHRDLDKTGTVRISAINSPSTPHYWGQRECDLLPENWTAASWKILV